MTRYFSLFIAIISTILFLLSLHCGEEKLPPKDDRLCVWVADEYNNAVRKFSIDSYSEIGGLNVGLNDPRSVSVDERDGCVWIADRYHGRVVKIDANGKWLFATEMYKYTRVNWVTCDSTDGAVYVCVRDDSYVHKLDENGSEIARITDMGFPFFSYLDIDGSLWVSDEKNDRVYHLPGGVSGEVSADDVALLVIDVDGVSFISPDGLGGVFCVLREMNELCHYDKSGNLLCRIYGFNKITSLWYDIESGRLYAGDGGTLRLLKANLLGDFKVADAQISMLLGFGSIDYMQVSGYDGTLWVADKGRDSVHIVKGDISEQVREITGFHDPFGISIRDEVK
ncbi:MAG: hypothetical protein ACUVWP_07050 [bacterium]